MEAVPTPPDTRDIILIAEDDPSIRKILRMQLELEGYEVVEAEDGAEALVKLESVTPDLILLDMMMPNLDGHSTCQRIRADNRFRHTPIIFLTAKSDVDTKLGGLAEGANDYLTKPYDRSELVQRIKNLLGWGRAQRNCNPLTGLPGNPSIEAEVEGRLLRRQEFTFLYLDLDHFKAYNDFYGYREGDGVIRLLASVLFQVVESTGGPTDFVGHVGGDDFVVLCDGEHGRAVAEGIVQLFDESIPQLYSEKDRARGYVEIENRRGEAERFPMVSVTIAMVETARYSIEHIAHLNDMVAELKKVGKQTPGSVVAEDRRSDPPIARTGSDG